MRLHPLLVLSSLALATTAGAQEARVRVLEAPPMARAHAFALADSEPRAVLGLTTGQSGSRRDTLGVLVAGVHPGGPAEQAGIEEGNRLAAINGVNLRVPASDVEDYEATSLLSRRLTRELAKVKPGDAVELRVYGNGQTRTVRVRTASSDSLYARRIVRKSLDDRASIGVGIGSTGSVRDSLGVLVMSVNDTGPAARAGIEEGNRIAAINGVDLRVPREDRGDAMASSLRARRLQREMAKVKPGDEVELRVYAGGQFRTVRVRAVKAHELGGHNVHIFGEGMHPGPAIAPHARIQLREGARVREHVREVMPPRLKTPQPMVRMQHVL